MRPVLPKEPARALTHTRAGAAPHRAPDVACRISLGQREVDLGDTARVMRAAVPEYNFSATVATDHVRPSRHAVPCAMHPFYPFLSKDCTKAVNRRQ